MLIKYKDKEKYLKDMMPMVSLKYIDFLRDFIELDENKIKNLTSNEKKEYKKVSGKFMELIPIKAKREYESRGLVSTKSHQKYLHFLKLNELLK
ncbi:hypothetical protein AVT43_gp24 [Polaribacter phage P12002L]|uniref:Uncharacterized protein n=2 Tax=Incheonvirus TaxID=2976977 RepID=A0A0F7IJN8_9CAUD|nr:hypothetical protein AVT42_gp24 [Polaribacter phage P12002S]YP_009209684.1 hypothetical protein AVT43_gp24 [Polaribacter phage P12002L]AKG94198.1 hypothetical protein P12002L_0024 [Polaribacter phage P12002L]AKG94280.1 hypothetical protein P12002S_0024 [Polaribacter phage P12002S]